MINRSKDVESLFENIIYKNLDWCKSIDINDTEKLQEAKKIFKIKSQTENYTNIDNICRLFFTNTSIPRGFIKKKFYATEKSVNSLIEIKIKDNELAEFYNYAKVYNEMDRERLKKEAINSKGIIISEQKAKGKVLLLMLKKMYNDNISKLTDNIVIDTKIDNLLNFEISIAANISVKRKQPSGAIEDVTEKRKILFNYNEYHKILPFFNNKSNNNFLYFCFKEDNIISYDDIHKQMIKINKEQFEIINKIQIKEREKFLELTNEERNKMLSDSNRIDSIKLLAKYQVNKEIDLSEFELISKNIEKGLKQKVNKKVNKDSNRNLFHLIIYYRNKAFHNGIPDSGTFQDGIDLIKNHLN